MRNLRFRFRRWWLALLLGFSLAIFLAWGQVGSSTPEQIAPQALMTRLEAGTAPLILDVRSPAEYTAGHIPTAVNIPYREVPQRWPELAEFTDEMVVYCEVSIRAAIAERILEQTGFQQIVTLAGDMRGWRAAGLPLSPPVPGQDTINSIKKLSK